jgi:hypothetical protein
MVIQVMRRLLAAALTFTVGMSTYAFWNYSQNERESSPCESGTSSLLSRRGIIRVRGLLYGSPDGKLTLNESECGGAWAAVEFGPSFRASAETLEFLKRLNGLAAADRMSRAEVVMVGTWDLISAQPQGNEPRFVFSVTGLEQTGSISLISMVSN